MQKVANQNPNYRALSALAFYNSGAAVDAVVALALDKLYALRLEAIQTLGAFGKLLEADSASVSEWEEIRNKSITIAGLEALLGYTNRAIQQAAAYELAHCGNTSGIHLIEPDLHVNDAETRVRAREALVRARTH